MSLNLNASTYSLTFPKLWVKTDLEPLGLFPDGLDFVRECHRVSRVGDVDGDRGHVADDPDLVTVVVRSHYGLFHDAARGSCGEGYPRSEN